MTLAQSERAALADEFLRLGPDQPTLCEGWQTADLLTHLLVRERRPDGALGAFVRPLAGYTAKVAAGYAALPWSEQVDLLRSGPPVWNPMGWGKLDELTNGAEMLIHHEDARRGQTDWQPREFTRWDFQQMITLLRSPMTRMMIRKADIGVRAEITDDPDGNEQTVELHGGTPVVTLRGPAADIILWLAGRHEVRVELVGDADATATLAATERGL